jgi:hypothetical protein
MSLRERAGHHLAFSASQRRVLSVLLGILLIWCTVQYIRNRRTNPDPPAETGERSSELADRIDINTADWSTLAALPAIGEKRARDIVAYRQRVHDRDPTTVPFRKQEDLLRVDGIGYVMMQRLAPYLVFPGDPTTQPN